MTHITGDMVGTVGSETLAVLLTLGDTTLAQPLVSRSMDINLPSPASLRRGSRQGIEALFCISLVFEILSGSSHLAG